MSSNSRSGLSHSFTLTEIMVVLAIIGILGAVGMLTYQDYTRQTIVTEALAVADEGRIPIEVAVGWVAVLPPNGPR